MESCQMIRYGYKTLVILFSALVLYSVLFFNIEKEEVAWRQSQVQQLAEVMYERFDEWTAYNIDKSKAWLSTTNDPILIGPSLDTADAKQTYIRVELISSDNQIQLFWRTKDTGFSEEKSKVFTAGPIEAMVDGDVEQIRIDPAGKPGAIFALNKVQIKKYK
jgi:hypothetical protein